MNETVKALIYIFMIIGFAATILYIPDALTKIIPVNETEVKQNMIEACTMEGCRTELVENEYRIKVYCYCPEGNVVEKWDKQTNKYSANEFIEMYTNKISNGSDE